jgi:hypothetical protein
MKEINLNFNIYKCFTDKNNKNNIETPFDVLYIIGDIDWDIIVIVNHNIRNYLIKIGEK